MRYNRTRLRKSHKYRVFADFVQTLAQEIRGISTEYIGRSMADLEN